MKNPNMKSKMLGGKMPVSTEREPKNPKVKNLKEVKVNPTGRYSTENQSMYKAKKQAKNFSKNESTGYAANVTDRKSKVVTYKDGKKVKVTVTKNDKTKERGSETRQERQERRKNRKA